MGPTPSKKTESEPAPVKVVDKVRDYRIERFEDLRFTRKESEILADSKDSKGFAISWAAVRRALEAGCGHRRAAYIFSSDLEDTPGL